MGASESFCVAVHQQECVRHGKGCTPNAVIDDAGDTYRTQGLKPSNSG